jgi:hypothetical protein
MYQFWSFSARKDERVRKACESVKNIKNAAVVNKRLVFLKKYCCNQETGGVPLQFVHSGTIKLTFAHNTHDIL